jgi:lysozyme
MNKLGIDVSHWQLKVDWQKAKANGIQFAFIKATQGTAILDPMYKVNWSASRDVGIPRGAYHFYDYRVDPIKQAAWLLEQTSRDPGELGYVLDVEKLKAGAQGLRPPPTYADDLRRFCEFISTQTGTIPIIYTGFYWWKDNGLEKAAWARQYPLWIANYNNVAPLVPLPWGPDTWTFWQFTDRGPGLFYGVQSKQVDMNVWRYI